MKYFWTNTIWFIILGVITILELIYVLVKSKNRTRVFAFYLTVSGMTFLFEVLLFVFLKAYDYYPMIVNNISRLDDGLAGNLFSQFSVAATALLISKFDLKYYFYIPIAFIYGGIEELFLYLGIYKHNWYQTWITIAGLIVLFKVVKALYNKIVRGSPGPFFKYVSIYFAAFVPHTDLLSWPFRLIWGPSFSERFLPDPMNSAFLLFAVNFNILCITAMIIYFRKTKWWQTGIAVVSLYLILYIAFILDLIPYRDTGLFALFSTVEIAGIFISVFLADKLYGYENKRPAELPSH